MESHRNQILDLVRRPSKAMHYASPGAHPSSSILLKAFFHEDLDEVLVCCSRMEKEGEMMLLRQSELRAEVFFLGFDRREVKTVIIFS